MLHIIHLEDNPADAELIANAISAAYPDAEVLSVSNLNEFKRALDSALFDVVLMDYSVPGGSAMDALDAVRKSQPTTPVLLVSGSIGEEQAVEAIRNGASDYLVKDNLERLSVVLGRILREAEATRRRQAMEGEARNQEMIIAMAGRMAQLGGWIVEVELRRVTWSRELCTIHEIPPDRVPTTLDEATQFIVPQQRDRIQQLMMRCLESGISFDQEIEARTFAGRPLWLRVIAEAVRHDDGRVVRIQGASQDITQRVEARLSAERTSQRLSETLESISDAFYTLDADWRFAYVNKRAETLLRRNRSELLGGNIWELFPEAVGGKFHTQYEHARRNNTTVSFTAYYQPLSLWTEVRAYSTSAGLAVYFQDITSTYLAREELRQTQERFNLVAKATNDAIWDWNVSTGQMWWNEGYLTMFGAESTEAPSYAEWQERLHPDDRARILRAVADSISSGSTFAEEYRFRKTDGSYATVLDRGRVITNPEGVATRMIGVIVDLTERRRNEQLLAEQAALIDQAHDAIVVSDLDHNVRFWSKGAERLYGFAVEEMVGKPYRDALKIEDEGFREADRVVRTQGVWTGELVTHRKDGSKVTVDASWTLLRDREDAPSSILTIDTDISERKQLEQQVLRTQRLESLGTLAGGIAHDLNNVLAPIVMAVGLLQRNGVPAGSDKLLKTIQQSAGRGAELVKQVLSFARGVEGERVPVKVESVVAEIELMIRNTFPKAIALEIDLEPGLKPITADPTQINQLLLNLCVNARDAMPEGGQVTITARNVDADSQYVAMRPELAIGSYVLIEVSDTGTGIPPENIERIFEPFFTTKEIGRGTGMGLSTAIGIVRSHRGRIDVQSEVGVGTKFLIHLPASADATAANQTTTVDAPRGSGELILVVDDEASILSITQQTLEAYGYRAITAEDGARAIAAFGLHQRQIALVVTDVMMPVVDGPTLIRALKGMAPALPIIVVSGFQMDENVRRAKEAGVTHYLAKPYTADALLAAIDAALNQKL